MDHRSVVYLVAGILLLITSAVLIWRFGKKVSEKAASLNKKLKMQMTSNIAHELRTPVTSIRGYLETLIACPDMDPEKKQMFLERAYNQTLRLSDLISDMALITKIEESPDRLPKEEIDIYDVATEVFDELFDRIVEKNVVVENFLKPETMVYGNRTLLYAILRNLVENSLKYAGEGVTLHIECYSRIDRQHYFMYYDTGRGVPEEHMERIFERFYRVDKGRSREQGGTGLGLAIVKHIIENHGEKVSVRSELGVGSTFTFTLKKVDL